ncbi:MAG: signal recognition particle protein [Candidatus Glassbacteria bacterium RIFCSPLOWO2_12_FULL_58_11]|uniref:Signal recognition particle protein n=2 Tax=Candidatus Glassiibacteriota TaxID=1817805 RepID=A0A1F5Z387_9BACT|nr:MAG: signal recognition particle protein [Candidatus Glassbacteria bacterium GWA2_58_10]OGG06901.1 MAG: signal recognition particle protein [Candidatus Glassbacteria bacterium RIFCSPLOWO2_12_FULL_58_11]
MFDELSEKLESVIKRISGRVVLNEQTVAESLREIRRVLLEADVNYGLVQDFLKAVEEKATGREVIKSVSPGQMMVKIVYDELTGMLGGSSRPLIYAAGQLSVFMLCGLQGSGKTTTAGKLARRLKAEGRKPMLVAADIYRPAAIEQLATLGAQLEVPTFVPRDTGRPVTGITADALMEAASQGLDTVLIDTAGRLQIDREMMEELVEVKKAVSPQEVLLVVDGMTGQEAVSIAEAFHRELELTGLVLTKLDGDARGGAALSIFGVTGVPIKLIGVGEGLDALETFHPDRMVSRLLQMGDIVSLVERAEERIDQEEAERLEKKVLRHGDMDLEDFLSTLRQMQKLGSMESVLRLIPGVSGKLLKGANIEPKKFKRLEAIILSMTPRERAEPKLINASRRQRIATGCGQSVQDVNQLLNQFAQMRKMMKQMGLFSGRRGPGIPGRGFNPFAN